MVHRRWRGTRRAQRPRERTAPPNSRRKSRASRALRSRLAVGCSCRARTSRAPASRPSWPTWSPMRSRPESSSTNGRQRSVWPRCTRRPRVYWGPYRSRPTPPGPRRARECSFRSRRPTRHATTSSARGSTSRISSDGTARKGSPPRRDVSRGPPSIRAERVARVRWPRASTEPCAPTAPAPPTFRGNSTVRPAKATARGARRRLSASRGRAGRGHAREKRVSRKIVVITTACHPDSAGRASIAIRRAIRARPAIACRPSPSVDGLPT